eukprot:4099916-Prymnesium_polylepis.1
MPRSTPRPARPRRTSTMPSGLSTHLALASLACSTFGIRISRLLRTMQHAHSMSSSPPKSTIQRALNPQPVHNMDGPSVHREGGTRRRRSTA